ncbi:MAG TPA: hypothetical protein VGN97_02440 [Mesorhizobium sp.]|jgi:hypothetical protein|nr:hypothetical protein [Mesorhizobium sp.]
MHAMEPGWTEVLSRVGFDTTFQAEAMMEDRKRSAALLAERCGCSVIFIGEDTIFARFTRKQDRAGIRSSERWSPLH